MERNLETTNRGRMTRVLVAGASGYLGQHVLPLLEKRGFDIRLVVRPSSQSRSAPCESPLIFRSDDRYFVSKVVDWEPDAICNLAGTYVYEHAPEDVSALFESNMLLGILFLEAARHTGSFVINVGTAWQMDGDVASSPSLYVATRRSLEDFSQLFEIRYGVESATAIIHDTYGDLDPRPKVLGLLVRAAVRGDVVELSSPSQLLNVAHIRDVADGIVMAIEQRVRGTIDLRSDYLTSLQRCVNIVEKAAGLPLRVRWKGQVREGEVPPPSVRTSADIPVGWRQRITLDEGLTRAVSIAQRQDDLQW